jgi:hypothetical protein
MLQDELLLAGVASLGCRKQTASSSSFAFPLPLQLPQ